MYRRCFNDTIFGYCTQRPVGRKAIIKHTTYNLGGRPHTTPEHVIRCRFDHHTCPRYLTFSQVVPIPQAATA